MYSEKLNSSASCQNPRAASSESKRHSACSLPYSGLPAETRPSDMGVAMIPICGSPGAQNVTAQKRLIVPPLGRVLLGSQEVYVGEREISGAARLRLSPARSRWRTGRRYIRPTRRLGDRGIRDTPPPPPSPGGRLLGRPDSHHSYYRHELRGSLGDRGFDQPCNRLILGPDPHPR